MTANTKTKSKIELAYPNFSADDYRSGTLFRLPMEPFGGKGSRKGTLKDLVALCNFRMGVQFEPVQRPNGKWIVKMWRRGGRKIHDVTNEVATREEAELEFASNFMRHMPKRNRRTYFNIERV